MEESEEDGILMSKHLPDSHPATLALPLLVSPPHPLPSLALSPSSPSWKCNTSVLELFCVQVLLSNLVLHFFKYLF